MSMPVEDNSSGVRIESAPHYLVQSPVAYLREDFLGTKWNIVPSIPWSNIIS